MEPAAPHPLGNRDSQRLVRRRPASPRPPFFSGFWARQISVPSEAFEAWPWRLWWARGVKAQRRSGVLRRRP